MADTIEPDKAAIRARLAAAGLSPDAQQLDRLTAIAGRLSDFARLNRLGEDLFDEPAVTFDLPLRGSADER